jgi:hypothetical protein
MPKHATSTSFKPGAEWTGNPGGRPRGIIEKQPRSLKHLQDKALKVIESHLDQDDLRAGTYVYDQNMGTAPQQSSPVELLQAVLQILEKFPDAAEALKSNLLAEENENASQASILPPD